MSEPRKKVTAPAIRAMKGKSRIGMLTAYDYPSARVADAAGADIILVGDSLAMVVLGYPDTLSVTVDDMLHHTRAVVRGTQSALIVGDMPYLSYHVSLEESVRNAGRFMQAGAHAVKVEGAKPSRLKTIEAILDAEVPVMGHIGLTPQSVNALGGFKLQGKIHRNRGPLADFGADADVASMRFHNPLGNAQAQPAAFHFVIVRRVTAIKALEDARKLLGRNARTGVCYHQLGRPILPGQGQVNLPLGLGVLDGVVGEVEQQLLQAMAVPLHQRVLAGVQFDLLPSRLRQQLKLIKAINFQPQ